MRNTQNGVNKQLLFDEELCQMVSLGFTLNEDSFRFCNFYNTSTLIKMNGIGIRITISDNGSVCIREKQIEMLLP